jgi:hypothetical protein
MSKEDEYTIYIRQDGVQFYCKNGKFHRESGPAIVSVKDKDRYAKLLEENMYKEKLSSYVQLARLSLKLKKVPTEVMSAKSDTRYFLNNVEYSKQEFNAITLQKELSQENKTEYKRPKL